MKKTRTRTFRVGGFRLLSVAAVLAAAVALNLLVTAIPSRWRRLDLSPAQYYTLSDQTREILKGLDSEVKIYWVVRDGYQNDMLKLLLEEYRAASRWLVIEEVDPNVNPTFLAKYTTDEARDNTIIVEKGTFWKYYDYYDIFQFVENGKSDFDINFCGENCITSGIEYAIRQKMSVVVSLTGHGESALSADVIASLEKENIEVSTQSVTKSGSIPEEADAVLVCAPQTDLSREDVRILEEFLAAGGNLILITNPEEEGKPLTNIRNLMDGYGVDMAEGVVVEADSGYYAYETPYYLLPYRNAHVITNPLTKSGYYVLMPISAGLQVKENLREGLYVSRLLSTSDSSFSKRKAYNLDTYEKEEGDIDGPFSVAVAIKEAVPDGGETRIVWAATDKFLEASVDDLASGGNMQFFLNCMDWIIEKEDSSIAIRGKSVNDPVLVMTSRTRLWLKIVAAAVIPLLYLGIGVIIFVSRRKRKAGDKKHLS